MSKKIIAVTGATGAQGGGLVQAILNDPNSEFSVRAITRKPESEAGRALAAAGAEVVAGDMDDADSMARAFEGAYGAFCVTNFWEHFSPEREMQQAKNLATAAQRAGVKHVVWSTLEDTRNDIDEDNASYPTLQGKYKVPHFDAKGQADAYFREMHVPTTFYRASFYWDNFIKFGMGPKRGEDGVLRLVLPMGAKKLSGVAAADIGPVAYGIFKAGPSMIGQTVGVAGDENTGEEIAALMSDAVGEKIEYQDVPTEVYRGFGFPGAEDLGNMFQYYQDYEQQLAAVRDVKRSRDMHPGIQNFRQWVSANAAGIQV